jgi:hypothetical protein
MREESNLQIIAIGEILWDVFRMVSAWVAAH